VFRNRLITEHENAIHPNFWRGFRNITRERRGPRATESNCRSYRPGESYSGKLLFSRSRISLPGLKWGCSFAGTTMLVPLPGFRPGRPRLARTLNAPMPRNSTRSPRTMAAVISSMMVLTIFSASPRRRRSFRPATRWISSVFSTNQTVASSRASRQGETRATLDRRPHCSRFVL
jgi:hypothetical protein